MFLGSFGNTSENSPLDERLQYPLSVFRHPRDAIMKFVYTMRRKAHRHALAIQTADSFFLV